MAYGGSVSAGRPPKVLAVAPFPHQRVQDREDGGPEKDADEAERHRATENADEDQKQRQRAAARDEQRSDGVIDIADQDALQGTKKSPPVSPDRNNQIAAGSQMIAGPPGMMPKKPVASPRRNGAGTTPESQ